MVLKVGINGFGRIGRACLRIALKKQDIEVVAVNDVNPDIENMAYLLKYDSTYRRLPFSVEACRWQLQHRKGILTSLHLNGFFVLHIYWLQQRLGEL